ncbi:MAG: 4Fe-4S dicluster domain-containing protein [Bacteroidales bacterium]|nr:4Fe-4S dicluster domain-containing protein [Bacteroidales bacterium]
MNNLLILSKRKIINNLDEVLLDIEKNIRTSSHFLQWVNSDVSQNLIRKKEKKVFYITEGNLIIYFDDNFDTIEKSLIITPRNILSNINDFYEISKINKYSTNFQIINLNTIKTKLTIYFTIHNKDLKMLKDKHLRKLFYCIDCGKCQTVCPINLVVSEFSPIDEILRQYEQNESINEPLCTSCKACEKVCPVNIKLSEYLLNLKFKKDKSFTERILLLFNKNEKYHIKTNKYINNRLKST